MVALDNAKHDGIPLQVEGREFGGVALGAAQIASLSLKQLHQLHKDSLTGHQRISDTPNSFLKSAQQCFESIANPITSHETDASTAPPSSAATNKQSHHVLTADQGLLGLDKTALVAFVTLAASNEMAIARMMELAAEINRQMTVRVLFCPEDRIYIPTATTMKDMMRSLMEDMCLMIDVQDQLNSVVRLMGLEECIGKSPAILMGADQVC